MSKLTILQLRKIIAEEVQVLREGDKEDQAAAMAQNASKLLKAIESFKLVASAKVKSSADSSGFSLEKHLLEVEKMLKRVVASPIEHVDGPKLEPMSSKPNVKKVSLKSV